jgi:opacity protein-like surface antigen
MRAKRLLLIASALIVLIPAIAAAATTAPAAPAASTPPAVTEKKLQEVVKGVYFEADLGYIRSLKSDVPSIGNGMTLSVLAGYDILDIVAIEGGYTGAYMYGSKPGTFSPGQAVPGDFTMNMLTVDCKVSYVSTEHWFFYLRVGGGYSFNSPNRAYVNGTNGTEQVDIPSGAPVVTAAAGAEYYTNIRHFSIGMEVKTHILPTISTYLLSVQPYLKFSF